MGKEYTISIGMKIFYGLLAIGMFAFAIVLFGITTPANQVLLLMPVLIICGSVLIIVNIIKRKVVIYDDRILCINLFTTKELALADIKGCRMGQKVIVLEPISDAYSKIFIGNYTDFSDSDELVSYFTADFKDLDAIDLENDKKYILEDTGLGYTVTDREDALKKAKIIAVSYNIIGVAGCFALLFLVGRYAVVIMGLIYPLLALPMMKFSKGPIKFVGNNKRSVNPYLVIGFMMPALIMLFNSLDDYQIFEYKNLWIPIILIVVVVSMLIYFTGINRAIGGIKAQIFMIIIMASIYGFDGTISINCAFDKSIPQIYKAKVLDHRIEHGKHTSYLLTLTAWGQMHQQKEEDVGGWLYNTVSIGDTVKVYLRKGILKAPWYRVGL